MSKEYPCVYYDNEICRKFTDDKVTSYCVLSPCPDVAPSNGDWLRSLDDAELATYLAGLVKGGTFFYSEEPCTWMEWLQQPHEGGRA